jgi:HPt (histidine-containing phosphotransfer) domain-containing protein
MPDNADISLLVSPCLASEAPSDDGSVLDLSIFNSLCELLGDQITTVLEHHCQATDDYMKAIDKGLEASNYNAMNKAAHPIKSSHQQIGALHAAAIAQLIETACKQGSPDPLWLAAQVAALRLAVDDATNAIRNYMSKNAT